MKNLKSYNETLHPNLPLLKEKSDIELYLQYMEWYDNILAFDTSWDEYINNLFKKYGSNSSYDSMEDIISIHPNPIEIFEFAQKRFTEIEEENKEDLDILKAIFEDLEDSCHKFINEIKFLDYSRAVTLNEIEFKYRVQIKLINKIIDYRKDKYRGGLIFKPNEVKNLWPGLISAMTSIESLGLEVTLDYKASSEDVFFTIRKKNEDREKWKNDKLFRRDIKKFRYY